MASDKLNERRKNTNDDVLRAQIQKYKEVFIEACHQAQKLDEALIPYLGEAQHITDQEAENNVAEPSVIMYCPRCGKPMTLRTKKDGKGFYVGCSGYPDCRASLWLPDFVLDVKVTSEICSICTPGPVVKLHFRFKSGSVPHSISQDYTGCIGGCDEMLMESLGLRPISRQSQGNNVFTPYSQSTPVTSRNTQHSLSNQTIANRGRGGQNTSSSNSFHTWTSDTRNNPSISIPATSVVPNRNNSTYNQKQTRPGMTVTAVSNLPSLTREQQRNNSHKSTSLNNNGGLSSDGDKDIMCNCGRNAILLTVRKEGPNTGRQFYKCSSQGSQGCNFFLWSDENDGNNEQRSSLTVGNRSDNSFTRNNKTRSSNADPENTNDVKCRCGLPAKSLIVSKPGANTGRPFYGCSKPREQSCNFFQWADESSADSGRQSVQGRSASYSLTPFLPGSGRKRSSFTHSDGPKQRKPPKCGQCGEIGHRKTKCPERLNDF